MKRKSQSYYAPAISNNRNYGRQVSVPVSRSLVRKKHFAKSLVRGIASAHPYGRMALQAYDAAKFLRKSFGGKSSGRGPLKTTGGPNARYSGKFRKKMRRVSKKADPYMTKGFRHTIEIHGQVTDPNCVYVGHTTFSGRQTLEFVCQALLRKLLDKAGARIRDIHSPIPGYEANTSTMWKFVCERTNKATGAVDATVTYITPAATNTSIYQIVGDQQAGVTGLWPSLWNVMNDAAIGFNGANDLNVFIPTRLVLYQEEENITQFWQFRSELFLEQEYVHITCKSDMKIQNRSVSASGSGSTDIVDANPLVGKAYRFNGGAPRARVPNCYLVEAVPDLNGVITARAASLTTAGCQSFVEPPPVKAWWNCTKFGGIRLAPGEIKNDSISFTTKMQLHKFLKNMKFGYATGGKQINLFGKSALYALEDMINVNASQNIAIAYEVNRVVGCYLTTTPNKIALGRRYTAEQNDITP